jgi:hypothetical protein
VVDTDIRAVLIQLNETALHVSVIIVIFVAAQILSRFIAYRKKNIITDLHVYEKLITKSEPREAM